MAIARAASSSTGMDTTPIAPWSANIDVAAGQANRALGGQASNPSIETAA